MAGEGSGFWNSVKQIFTSPGVGQGANASLNEFMRLAALFWAAVKANDLQKAEQIFITAVNYAEETGIAARVLGTVKRMQTALTELRGVLLLAAEEGAADAAAAFFLGEGGWIVGIVILGIFVFKDGRLPLTPPAYGETGPATPSDWRAVGRVAPSGPIVAQPHPVYTEQQIRQIQERHWRTLIVGPAPTQQGGRIAMPQENRIAARAMLKGARNYSGRRRI